MRKLLLFATLTMKLLAQSPCIGAIPYIPPGYAVFPTITAAVDPSGTVHFNCYNLASMPNLTCPSAVALNGVVGTTTYFGISQTGQLVTTPAPGTYDIANCISGFNTCQSLWTGVPALPLVNVIGCNSYSIAYVNGTITVNCTGN